MTAELAIILTQAIDFVNHSYQHYTTSLQLEVHPCLRSLSQTIQHSEALNFLMPSLVLTNTKSKSSAKSTKVPTTLPLLTTSIILPPT
jgi:hypothetical protein